MPIIVFLSLLLAVIAVILGVAASNMPIGARLLGPRRPGEHWTVRRARHERARKARLGAIWAGSASVLLQGVAIFLL